MSEDCLWVPEMGLDRAWCDGPGGLTLSIQVWAWAFKLDWACGVGSGPLTSLMGLGVSLS